MARHQAYAPSEIVHFSGYDPEEQADSLSKLVGAPTMMRNEGRARLNLPSMDDAASDQRDAAESLWRQAARLQRVPEEERGAVFGQSLRCRNHVLATDLGPTSAAWKPSGSPEVSGETLALLDAGASAFDRKVVA